jgi:hypothetical protein
MKDLFGLIFFSVILSSCIGKNDNNTDVLNSQIDSLKFELSQYKNKYGELSTTTNLKGDFGMWKIEYYVDNFGDKTSEGYITNSDIISGHFSNTATSNSNLGVSFLINDKENIAIMLFEYMQSNPVKDDGMYIITIKETNNQTWKLWAFNHSDRLVLSDSGFYDETGNKLLEKSHALKLWNILTSGGEIKFHIQKSDRSTSTYNFTIKDAGKLEQAYLSISKSNKD